MGAWADLPAELVAWVVEELSFEEDLDDSTSSNDDFSPQQDLLSCTHVSHQFKAAAERRTSIEAGAIPTASGDEEGIRNVGHSLSCWNNTIGDHASVRESEVVGSGSDRDSIEFEQKAVDGWVGLLS